VGHRLHDIVNVIAFVSSVSVYPVAAAASILGPDLDPDLDLDLGVALVVVEVVVDVEVVALVDVVDIRLPAMATRHARSLSVRPTAWASGATPTRIRAHWLSRLAWGVSVVPGVITTWTSHISGPYQDVEEGGDGDGDGCDGCEEEEEEEAEEEEEEEESGRSRRSYVLLRSGWEGFRSRSTHPRRRSRSPCS
jgi:hypothetical protein